MHEISGGTGKDVLQAGPGADRIKFVDGARDKVRCGTGNDDATVDERDDVRGCEQLSRA